MLDRWSWAPFWAVAATASLLAGFGVTALGYWMPALMLVAVSSLLAPSLVRWDVGKVSQGALTKPNFVLIALPTAISLGVLSKAAALLGLLALAGATFRERQPGTAGLQLNWACAILPAIGLAIAWRPNAPEFRGAVGAMSVWGSVAIFTVACLVIARAVVISDSKWSALTSLVDGAGLFLVLSVALRFAGVTGTNRAAVGGNLLTGGERIGFPLTTSYAATPAVAAVYLVAIAPILMTTSQYRVPRLITSALAFAIIALGDRRSASLAIVAVLGMVFFAPMLFRRFAPWLVGGALAIPFFADQVAGMTAKLSDAARSSAPILIRQGNNLDTGRTFVWSRAMTFFHERVDVFHQFVGHGAFGHAASGANRTYASETYFKSFGYEGAKTFPSPHSTAIQMLFDGGWIVVIAFFATVSCMALVLSQDASRYAIPGLAALTALCIGGSSDVLLTPSQAQPTWWIFLVLATIVFSHENTGTDDTGDVTEEIADRRHPGPPTRAPSAETVLVVE